MPDSTIVSALVAGLGYLATWVSLSNQVASIKAELAALTKQVEKHNSVVERTYKLETDEATMWRRIDELREDVKHNSDRLDSFKLGGSD